MKILFAHDNFPAQFGAFGGWLARRGWDVRFATAREDVGGAPRFLRYKSRRAPTSGVHPYAAGVERAVINGQAAARAFLAARERGYAPDIVMAHSGWGSGMYARDIWPDAKFVPYLEWWYQYPPPDMLSLGGHRPDLNARLLQRTRNAPALIDMEGAPLALCPTLYQASRFPAGLRERLTVIHDGIDCALHRPSDAPAPAAAGLDLSGMPEIVTFITRGMEPHRGFPQFMRALADLQAARPDLHAIIGGEDRVAYGAQLPEGESWKGRMLAELGGALDLARVHFVGLQPRREYVRLLQASDAHVYLTADFVLSWSMLEAMAVGCPLIVSDCAPVREFMTEDAGLFCGLHDQAALTARIAEALDDREAMRERGRAAREVILARCDQMTVWPAKERLLKTLL